jgi:hypothetical protein
MASNAIETAKQENGSKVYFEQVIEKNKDPDKHFNDLSVVIKSVYPGVTKDWMDSYAKQAKALKKFLGNKKGYLYSRDNGFMPFIEGIAKSRCGVTQKDRWNPADIYLIKKDKESEVKTKLKQITDGTDKDNNLLALNGYMKDLLEEKIMIPVSLKAISKSTKDAKAELANVKKQTSHYQFKLKPGSVKCILTMGNKNAYEFDTGEFAFDFYVGDEEIHGQSRNFQYSKERNLIQTDLTPKGRSGGAKLGKVSSVALDDWLKKHGLQRPSSAAKDPNIDPPGKWKESNIDYWIDMIKKIERMSIQGKPIDLGELTVKSDNKIDKGPEAIIKSAVLWEDKTRNSAGRFSSKLIGLRWAYIWAQIDKMGKMEDWLKTLYYGAKKEFGEKNGPFLKIY